MEREGTPHDNEKKGGITRGEFIAGGLGAFIGAASGSTVDRIIDGPEKGNEEKVGRILLKSDIVEFKVTEGQGIESFYGQSGWQEYGTGCFKLAVEHLNPALKERQLQLNEPIKIPVRKAEDKE